MWGWCIAGKRVLHWRSFLAWRHYQRLGPSVQYNNAGVWAESLQQCHILSEWDPDTQGIFGMDPPTLDCVITLQNGGDH